LSRAHPGLIKYLLKIHVPEIQEKLIEIKDIARIAGFKTKLSVISHQPGVEAVGTIIGARGSRIKTVQEQIHGEHIEVIEYSDDFRKYIVDVCSPAEISGVTIIEPKTPAERRQIIIVTKPDKTALLIGKKGSNIRLISELLKADIEIQNLEEAHVSNLQYERIDVQNSRQQAFNRTYSKYKSGADILKQYKTVKIDNKDMSLDKQTDKDE
jgi:N utilization substance protein A